MTIIESVLLEQEVYGVKYFKYFINTKSERHTIEILRLAEEGVALCLYDFGARVHPDVILDLTLSLHPILAHILIKNVDILELDGYRRLMVMSVANFENVIKPYLKVVGTK